MNPISQILNTYPKISIIGMSKNAGKTVALNALLEDAHLMGISVGLTSIGRDGEKEDIVTATPKPSIYLYEGSLIATSKTSISRSSALIELLSNTYIPSPMGDIYLGRVIRGGMVEIAGPNTNSGIEFVSNELKRLGAYRMIIDGALDRASQASPAVSDVCILASGACISRRVSEVVEATLHRVSLLSLEQAKHPLLEDAFRASPLSVIYEDDTIKGIDIKTALMASSELKEIVNDAVKYIAISGALSDTLLGRCADLFRSYPDIKWVVRDGTRIFVDRLNWRDYLRKGFRPYVKDSINVGLVTVNPYSPKGYTLDPKELLMAMRSSLKGIEVLDIYGGRHE